MIDIWCNPVSQGFGGRGPRPCAFFNTPNGCKKGDYCRFAHIPATGHNGPHMVDGQGMPQGFGLAGMGQGMDQGMGMQGMSQGTGFGMDMDMGMGHGGPGPDMGFDQGFGQYHGDDDDAHPEQSRHRCCKACHPEV